MEDEDEDEVVKVGILDSFQSFNTYYLLYRLSKNNQRCCLSEVRYTPCITSQI